MRSKCPDHPGAFRNRLLAALPAEEIKQLHPYFELFEMPKGQVLYEAGDAIHHVYFPESGMVTLLSTTSIGNTIAAGVAGFDGVVGTSIALKAEYIPFRAIVQIPGYSWRIRSQAIRAQLDRCGLVQEAMLGYANVVLTQVTQSAVCNYFHTAQRRLCRWLLVSLDHSEDGTLPLTQENIAAMLGIQRSHVAAITEGLQRSGVIRYRWGRITILDRSRLEAASCECYGGDAATTVTWLKDNAA